MNNMSENLQEQFMDLADCCNVDYEYLENLTDETNCLEFLSKCISSIQNAKGPKKKVKKKAKVESNDPLTKKAKELETELAANASTLDDTGAMRSKNVHLMNSVKKLTEKTSIMESFIEKQNKKMNVLIEHVEKLMKYIKMETSLKNKAFEAERTAKGTIVTLKQKIEKQQRTITTEKRLVEQIAEGSKILEDQLKLMDEKYLEMRMKLDSYRTQFNREAIKAKKEVSDIRLKYAMANDGALLDSVKIRPKTAKETQNTQQLSWADTLEFQDVPVANASSYDTIAMFERRNGDGSVNIERGRVRPKSAAPAEADRKPSVGTVKSVTTGGSSGTASPATSLKPVRPLSASTIVVPVTRPSQVQTSSGSLLSKGSKGKLPESPQSKGPNYGKSSRTSDDHSIYNPSKNDGKPPMTFDGVVDKIERKNNSKKMTLASVLDLIK